MTDENGSQNFSKNGLSEEKTDLSNGINPSQEQQIFLARPPKSLVAWLVRVHLRLIALEKENPDDSNS